MIYNELEKLKEKDTAVRNLRNHLDYIEAIPLGMEISSQCGWGIFMKDDHTLKDIGPKLTKFRELNGKYEVDGYDLYEGSYGSPDRLHVRYKFANGIKVNFYILNYEEALEVLGQGKCKIVEEFVPSEVKTIRRVECDI